MRLTMRKRGLALLAVLLGSAAGCQLPYFMMAKEPKKQVLAEYDKFNAQRIAIIVWADQATLEEDYAARFRVADSVRYYLQEALPKLKPVDIRKIIDYQESEGTAWEGLTNVELGKRFDADGVLRVDLLDYTTRSHDERTIRLGRIRGTISVFDLTHPSPEKAVYSTEINAIYPEDSKTNVLNLSDIDILNGAAKKFGEILARKFYDHEESYK